ncbi:hypothetical protein GGR53DRAFT_530406 [Hypoxylon sp. FL1150]|nr:hypothetical protein GGR53DRAFT_530406 [Hypoxylon sp. FL1150]
MTQPTWKGDRLPTTYPAQRRHSNLSSYTTSTPHQPSSNFNRNPSSSMQHSSLPSIRAIEPPYDKWRSMTMGGFGQPTQMGFGQGDYSMGNQFVPGPAPNQWVPEYMNDPNRNLGTLNSASNIPNHIPMDQNGPGFSNHSMPLPGAPSSDAGSSSSTDFDEPTGTPRIPNSKRVGHKGRPRVGAHGDRRSTALGATKAQALKWYKGIKEKPIPEDASDEQKEKLKEFNRQVGQARKEHTREQNRVSAQKSRHRKQENLETAQKRAADLEEQVTQLQEQVRQLTHQNAYQQTYIQRLGYENSRLQGYTGANYETRPQGFNAYSQLQGPNALGQTSMSTLNVATYPASMAGSASSPAVMSASPGQFGNYLPTQSQGLLPPQSQNAYQSTQAPNSVQPQNLVQASQGTNQAQSGTDQMDFAYDSGATNSNTRAQQQEGSQENLSGSLPENLQDNYQGDFQEGNIVNSNQDYAAPGEFLSPSPAQGQSNEVGFELGLVDTGLNFMRWGSGEPINAGNTAQDPSSAGAGP